MSQSTTPAFAPTEQQRERLDRNLTALEQRQPDLARRLREIEIPNSVVCALGRDGTSTVQILNGDGAPQWFGHSSMPSISAPAFFADAQYRGGNAALPGVFTGLEPRVLLDRLPGCAALFVLEDDALNVAIACHLYDYADAITSGRLVFILAHELGANLSTYIRRHPGYELPSHLYHVPQRSAAALADLQRRLEEAGRTAVDIQRDLMGVLAGAIASRSCDGPAETPRVALLSTDARPAAQEHIRRVVRALDGLGWTYSPCAPDAPGQCHNVARLQAIDRCAADLVLFINHGATGLRGTLPPALPVVSWWFEPVPDSEDVSVGGGPFDVVVVTADAEPTGDDLQANRVLRCDPAGDDRAFRADPTAEDQAAAIEADVLVPCDLPDDRADARGVALASHVSLWSAVRRIVAERIDRPRAPDVESVLADAASVTGIQFGDAGVRARFVELIRVRAVPAARSRSVVAACRHAGLRVALLGANWLDVGDEEVRWDGPIPPAEDLCPRFRAAGAIALPLLNAASVRIAIDALFAGTPVCIRADRADFERRFPSLIEIADHIVFAPTSRTLAHRVKDLRGNARDRADRAKSETLSDALAAHTVARRLEWIVNEVRARQRAATAAMPQSV